MSVYAGEIDITTLKVGDVFYECEYGFCLKLTVLIPPCRDEEGHWKWEAVTSEGKEVDYLVTEGYEHYGPKLYSYVPYLDSKMI